MKTDEIRKRYLDFFAARGHRVVPSDSLVPTNDPTLLFSGAGMNQFKEEFLGHVKDFRRATSCQKCIRTGDIENVGRTPFHFTFFEMLGNFSFGDYFKREAIGWAWEFLTQEMKLDPARLHVSVYEQDQEAYDLWANEVGVPQDHIWKYGEDDNFWPASAPSQGPNGVCGPCSEIYVDHGLNAANPCKNPQCSPACSCRRYTEIWNLVFTQFDRQDGGVLKPLPAKNIDTGMGLERMAAVMQGVRSGMDIDLMQPIVQAAAKLTGQVYAVGDTTPVAQRLKRIAEHTRCVAHAMADGALPDRYGRGYVIRRLIRRAALDCRRLGVEEPLLHKLVPAVVASMGATYPEVKDRAASIATTLKGEEERFAEALGNSKGIREFEDVLEQAAAGDKKLDGRKAFYFTDTHGLPLEFIEEQLADRGVAYDRAAYETAMEEQRTASRAGSNISEDKMIFKAVALSPDDLAMLRTQKVETKFAGYDALECPGRILAIVGAGGLAPSAAAGSPVEVILDRTTFYAKGGGQMGDIGTLVAPDAEGRVLDTLMDHEFRLHAVEITRGSLRVGDTVTARVSQKQRLDTGRNHTATHLLHWALRKVLGEHVFQAGSEVAPTHLRFDFTHTAAMTADELRRVEDLVNEKIYDAVPIGAVETTVDAARKLGAMALFGEKYGDVVRLVAIGDFSHELCGGTHLANTNQVGIMKIVREESVAAGVRRITAYTGRGAAAYVAETEGLLDEATGKLKANRDTLLQRIESLQKEIKSLKQDVQKVRSQASRSSAADVFAGVIDAGGVPLVAAEIPGADANALRELVDVGRKKLGSAVLVFGSREGDKVALVVGVTKDLIERGLHAGKIIKDVAAVVGGGGGGRPDLAQAGGKDPSKLPEAIAQAQAIVAAMAKK